MTLVVYALEPIDAHLAQPVIDVFSRTGAESIDAILSMLDIQDDVTQPEWTTQFVDVTKSTFPQLPPNAGLHLRLVASKIRHSMPCIKGEAQRLRGGCLWEH